MPLGGEQSQKVSDALSLYVSVEFTHGRCNISEINNDNRVQHLNSFLFHFKNEFN